jgi:hypothetical protein
MRFRRVIAGTCFAASALPSLFAPPPLVTGDVPTADKSHFELYTGFRYQDTGRIERQVPHVELVYGLTERWEVSAEANYLSRERRGGLDDVTLATKVMFLAENAARPAVAASYEYKFDNADTKRELGSGGIEHDFRLRAQKTFGWFTPIVNAGYVVVPDARLAGVVSARQNVWRASFAQEWLTMENLRLLSEVYWRGADEPGNPARLGWNIGFKHKLRDSVSWHGAIGESLRPENRGGPDLRAYVGFKFEFRPPWADRAIKP